MQVQPPSQPIVYTNASLSVNQRIEAVIASTEEGWNRASAVRDSLIYVATECAFKPIVRSVKASVERSIHQETVLAEWQGVERWYDTEQTTEMFSLLPDWNENLGIQPGQNLTLFPKSQVTIRLFLQSLFSGNALTGMKSLTFNQIRP